MRHLRQDWKEGEKYLVETYSEEAYKLIVFDTITSSPNEQIRSRDWKDIFEKRKINCSKTYFIEMRKFMQNSPPVACISKDEFIPLNIIKSFITESEARIEKPEYFL